LNIIYKQYEEEYGFNFLEITEEMYDNMTEAEKAEMQKVYQKLVSDQNYLKKYNLVINLTVLMTTLGILLGITVIEFVLPLIFKNGQTLGKKIFSICVIKPNGVRISTFNLFARTFLGKYAIEIMLPVYFVILLIFQSINIVILLIVAGLLLGQIAVYLSNYRRPLIHDLIAYTVVVDRNSQMIFDTYDELIKYKENNARIEAEKNTKTF